MHDSVARALLVFVLVGLGILGTFLGMQARKVDPLLAKLLLVYTAILLCSGLGLFVSSVL